MITAKDIQCVASKEDWQTRHSSALTLRAELIQCDNVYTPTPKAAIEDRLKEIIWHRIYGDIAKEIFKCRELALRSSQNWQETEAAFAPLLKFASYSEWLKTGEKA